LRIAWQLYTQRLDALAQGVHATVQITPAKVLIQRPLQLLPNGRMAVLLHRP
jgi:hypothetical protein